jgi:hypothetical protein
MSVYLIPVADALPAFEEHYWRWPGDGPPSAEEARDFIECSSASNELATSCFDTPLL